MYKISFTNTAYFTEETISDILSTAFEGGINYWTNTPVRVDEWPDGAKFASDVVVKGTPVFLYNEDDQKWEKLTLPNLINSIGWFLTCYNKDKDYFEEGDYDANDADIIVQHALFGEIVYG